MGERIERIMIELFQTLDLLGPAAPACTRRALAQVAVTKDSQVVDVGCGTGRQTLQLLEETEARITATDLHEPFLEGLQARAAQRGFGDRLTVRQADMAKLPFAPQSLDLIWCEGAIYNLGFEQGLAAWKPLLKPGGHVCLSEGAYFVDHPPAVVREFWESEYPAITTQARLEEKVPGTGYRLLDSFAMPRSAWEAYHAPLPARLDQLAAEYPEDEEVQQVVAAMRHEIEVCAEHGDTFGYVFMVLQKL